jgi:hypothetical protein
MSHSRGNADCAVLIWKGCVVLALGHIETTNLNTLRGVSRLLFNAQLRLAMILPEILSGRLSKLIM